jgi:hypothetical protein
MDWENKRESFSLSGYTGVNTAAAFQVVEADQLPDENHVNHAPNAP